MKKLLFLFILVTPTFVFSQDTVWLPKLLIEGYYPEPVLMNSYSNDLAMLIDTTKKPVVRIDDRSDPITEFLRKNITYPTYSVEMGFTGTIYAIFTVEKNGKLNHIKILRGIEDTLNKEVLRVLEKLPQFPPGDKVWSYIVPFKFILQNAIVRNKTIAKPQELNGDWKCVKRDLYITEEYIPPDLINNNLRISGDTIWHFEYPVKFYHRVQSLINSDWYSFENAWFQHDTLVIHRSGWNKGGFHYYLRDTFDQNIIDRLITDSIHLPSLFGKWYVETKRSDDVEYGTPIKIKYPVHVPSVFEFDETDIIENKMIYLKIKGKKRKFKVIGCSLYYGYIELESFEWSKDPFQIFYFNKKIKYNINRSRK